MPVIEERPQCPARAGWDGERLLWRYRCLGLHHPEFLLRDKLPFGCTRGASLIIYRGENISRGQLIITQPPDSLGYLLGVFCSVSSSPLCVLPPQFCICPTSALCLLPVLSPLCSLSPLCFVFPSLLCLPSLLCVSLLCVSHASQGLQTSLLVACPGI